MAVPERTGGRFKIQVFAGGELMPPTGVFDACAQGTVEAFNGGAYYWAGKETAFQWFTSVPFGLNAQGYFAWYHFGDGLKLWEEAYAPFGLVPRPAQSTNPQMAGWFRKKINSVDDFKGLKIRIPGLGGKVYAKAGSAVVLLPPGEIYTALERGTLDATEFVGPHDDLKLGLLHDEHVRVDIVYSKLSPRARARLNFVLFWIFFFPSCLLVIYTAWPFVWNSWAVWEGSPDPGGIPGRWALKSMIIIGFVLLLLQGIAEAIKASHRMRGREAPDGPVREVP
jgi:hypothetical protein